MADYSQKRAGNYTIIKKLGDGGFASVYLAQHTVLEKKAAVKFLLPEWLEEPDVVTRFFDEARTMERLHDNPHIVHIIDIATMEKCTEEGLPPYFIMEFIDGQSLEDLIKSDDPFTLEDILEIMNSALEALQHCHDNNVVHRDVKPANFMITSDGVVKLTDFGIAKAVKNTSKTGEGLTLGSTDYMSPEQALGKRDLDYRSDIYSLGVTLYQMVCDKLPFVADSANAVALMHIQEKPVPPVEINPDVPQRLNDIILKAMAKERENRFQSCNEMLEELKKLDEPYEPTVEMPAVDLTNVDQEEYKTHITGIVDAENGATRQQFAAKPPAELINAIRSVLAVIALTLIFLLGFYFYYYYTQAHLIVDTYPQGATIYLNKEAVGTSPVDLPVAPAAYIIGMSMPDYESAVVYQNLQPSQHLKVNRKLIKTNSPFLGEFNAYLKDFGELIKSTPEKPPRSKRDLAVYEEKLKKIESGWDELYAKMLNEADDERVNEAFLDFCVEYSDYQRADAFYQKLMAEKPLSMVCAYAGYVKTKLKDKETALKLYLEAWKHDKDNRVLLNMLGDHFVLEKNHARAKEYYDMSLFLYPDQDEIRKKLAELN